MLSRIPEFMHFLSLLIGTPSLPSPLPSPGFPVFMASVHHSFWKSSLTPPAALAVLPLGSCNFPCCSQLRFTVLILGFVTICLPR